MRVIRRAAAMAALSLGLGLVGLVPGAEAKGPRREPHAQSQRQHHAAPRIQRGRASFYASRFHGRRMANGRRFNRDAAVAASRTLPLGTVARVKNLENGRTAVVTIEDRGPHLRSRVIDLSPGTAAQLGMLRQGVAMVEVTPIRVPDQPG
ncbi:septal ring lytic transglycosylase RlpA family protein [Roseomonas sp. 18066]|uniref:septal ring lytic transglycosylase RlpA family protein n=1 Tax=Roseomonas sp. 18066 TaxID=2681412 RepID=UPI00135CD579|nr:septal ring lytic transglycosylase RlpA family protein [Roseomonas sp. 18066]